MKSLKFAFIALSVVGATAAHAKATLHIPLFVDGIENDKVVPMAEVNATLAKKGLPAQPEFLEVATDEKDFDYWAQTDKIDKALEAAGLKDAEVAFTGVPGQYDQGNYVTCYKGSGSEVAGFVASLSDGPFSDQYVYLGSKFGKTVDYSENQSTPEEMNQYFSDNSEEWKNYDKNSTDVLVLASVGDGGDDVESSLIPVCK